MVVRLDFIDKHSNKKKGSDKWNMDPKCMHVKNEIFYVQFFTTIILWCNFQAVEDMQKIIQFAIIFGLLNKSKPMTNYEDF